MADTLHIKNMVCPRCIRVVTEELKKLDVKIISVELGEVVTEKVKSELPLKQISEVLNENGFELIQDSRVKIIEKIKKRIISVIYEYDSEDLEKLNFSEYLSKNIEKDYTYLSSLFSKTEGITIERYIIMQKIERAKELLKYGEFTFSEIAYKLGYSSVQHLSRQFKQVTGMTSSQFKNTFSNLRNPINEIGLRK